MTREKANALKFEIDLCFAEADTYARQVAITTWVGKAVRIEGSLDVLMASLRCAVHREVERQVDQ